MSTTHAANAISNEFRRRTPTSAQLAAEAEGLFPSGVTHDARYFDPYSLYVERAQGSRKWDVDGNEYVDYFGGHGALLLGHSHPAVVAAIEAHVANGTHFGASHRHEIEWAQVIQRLVPSAERIRFASSGTEATMLAMRLVRAWSGKAKIVRFATHFHGWQDHAAFGVGSHHDGSPTPGVLQGIADNIILCPPNDRDHVRRVFAEHGDIAAVILEPTGATWGQVPTPPEFLALLRELTEQSGAVLIFDEVVTGFRCAAGGAQAVYGITPDVTTLAKIMAGGLPGAAVVGRREIMELLDHRVSAARGTEKVAHHGTFNANPLSAVAGVAALKLIETGEPCRQANQFAAELREGFRSVIVDAGLPWCVYGTFSGFHVFLNPDGDDVSAEYIESGQFCYRKIKQGSASPVNQALQTAMLIHGVHIMPWPGGPTSAAHNQADLDWTIQAFRDSIRMLKSADII